MTKRNAVLGEPMSSLSIHLGQLLIIGFDGTEMSPRLASLLERIQPAGVILFARNISSAAQTHRLLSECQQHVSTPLFTCVDLEGGQVDRFRNVLGPTPSAAEIFATNDLKLFRKHGSLIGENCRALGFNLDFAPVLDLAFESSKSVMSTRSVSADPRQVISYAREFLQGLNEAGILGCGKHFPGLGEGRLDSHHELPVIEKPLKKMWSEDVLPYRILRSKIPSIMVSHAAYPEVTGERTPASLSKKWITDILRKRIGYSGLIVSDDMEMGAVTEFAPIEQTVVGHIRAGGDIALVCHKQEFVERAHQALTRACESDRWFAKRAAEAVRRVQTIKRRLLDPHPAAHLRMHQRTPRLSAPTPERVEKLTRQLWEFGEQIRLATLASEESA